MQIDLTDTVDATAKKEAYAFQLLLCHGNEMEAATAVSPDNMAFRLHIVKYWSQDTYVIAHKKALVAEHGPAFFLPDKYDIGHKLMEIATKAPTSDDRLKALKQFAELMGMVDKAGAINNVNNNVTVNKVMVVQDHGDDDAWEKKALEQQRQLTIGHVKS